MVLIGDLGPHGPEGKGRKGIGLAVTVLCRSGVQFGCLINEGDKGEPEKGDVGDKGGKGEPGPGGNLLFFICYIVRHMQ